MSKLNTFEEHIKSPQEQQVAEHAGLVVLGLIDRIAERADTTTENILTKIIANPDQFFEILGRAVEIVDDLNGWEEYLEDNTPKQFLVRSITTITKYQEIEASSKKNASSRIRQDRWTEPLTEEQVDVIETE